MTAPTQVAGAPNASLVLLLRCLDRADVTQLELCSGEFACALRPAGPAPLTKTPLTAAQITALVAGTPMAQALLDNTGTPQTLTLTFGERLLRVVVVKSPERVRVAIAKPAPEHEEQHEGFEEPTGAAAAGLSPAAALAAQIERDAVVQQPAPTFVPPAASTEGEIDLGPVEVVARPMAAASPVHRDVPLARASAPPSQAQSSLQALDAWVGAARAARASDLHLGPNAPPRHRCAGQLVPASTAVTPAAELHDLALGLLSPSEQQTFGSVGYVDLAVALPTQGRVRVNISRCALGIKIALRLIPLTVPTLEALHLPEDLAAVARYHQGLAIVSGPSGHGKTATLAALVERINHHSGHHIILIEDPIEVVHPVARAVISQRQVGRDTASYARALKASLREDPDVIVVGELRDRETVEIALGAAETGHLVLATMNTRSAGKTIDRLIDLFPPEDQAQVRSTLAGSLKMVISQRLVPTVDGGLLPAVELLTGGVPLWALIRDNKLFQLPSLQQRGRSAGMIRLDTSLIALVQSGRVHKDVARSFAENVPEFDRLLAQGRP